MSNMAVDKCQYSDKASAGTELNPLLPDTDTFIHIAKTAHNGHSS
jgi:hypothetical protein